MIPTLQAESKGKFSNQMNFSKTNFETHTISFLDTAPLIMQFWLQSCAGPFKEVTYNTEGLF